MCNLCNSARNYSHRKEDWDPVLWAGDSARQGIIVGVFKKNIASPIARVGSLDKGVLVCQDLVPASAAVGAGRNLRYARHRNGDGYSYNF